MTATHCTKEGILIVLALLLNTPPLAAADSDMTQEYVTCMDKSGGVTPDMLECMSDELARQDALLNQNYKTLMSKLSAKRKKMLLEAQRAWIKFRDANCGFYSDPEGGTAAVLGGNDCFLQVTANRAKELSNLRVLIGDRSHDGDSEACNTAQCRLARLIASDRAPTNTRLKAQVASRLNQLRDTNLRPR